MNKNYDIALEKLYNMLNELNEIRETDITQKHESIEWAIDESIRTIDNAIHYVEQWKEIEM